MRYLILSLFLSLIVSLSMPLAGAAQNNKTDSVRSVDSTKTTGDTASKQNITELIEKAKSNSLTGVYEKVEIESQFPGGPTAWLAFLNSHLKYPNKAVRKRIEGTVLLQFIVNRDGSISDLKALSGDPLLVEAALKAMADSPRWSPAIQNGRLVKSYKKQPIIFSLERPN